MSADTVVLCADRSYRVPLAVVMKTLAEEHRSSELEVVVLHDGFDQSDQELIGGMAEPHRVRWMAVDESVFDESKLPSHLPRAALFRLLAPELLAGTSRLLYLDSDIVVTGDLAGLLDVELDGHPVAAARDAWIEVAGSPKGPPYPLLGLAADAAYFNSGVMVVDTEAWADRDVAGACLEILRRLTLPYADQCALNAVLVDDWTELHPRWNLQTAHGTPASHDTDPFRLVRVCEALEAPAIVHYTGAKPWRRAAVVRAELWNAAAERTPYRSEVSALLSDLQPWPNTLGPETGRGAAAWRRLGRRVVTSAARRAGVEFTRIGSRRSSTAMDPALLEFVVQQTGGVVADGPFAGMRVPVEASWGGKNDLVPKLLGTYEQELRPAVEEVVAGNPDRVVNLGCADGYYAIGLARRLPDATVIGVDRNTASLQIAQRAAVENDVADRMSFLDDLRVVPAAANGTTTAWIVDIEGGESALIGSEWRERLRNDLLIVECHDFAKPGVTGALCMQHRETHSITVVPQGWRNPNAIPLLRDLSEPERWLALSERRPRPMHWLVLVPRSSVGREREE